jgi:hypothetical protein
MLLPTSPASTKSSLWPSPYPALPRKGCLKDNVLWDEDPYDARGRCSEKVGIPSFQILESEIMGMCTFPDMDLFMYNQFTSTDDLSRSTTLVIVQSSEARRDVFDKRAVLSRDAEPPHPFTPPTHLPHRVCSLSLSFASYSTAHPPQVERLR